MITTLSVASLTAVTLLSVGAVGAQVGSTGSQLSVQRVIRTSPFTGSTVAVRDNEDVAYVEVDDALWIADDDTDAIYEVDRRSGSLRHTIPQASFMAARQVMVGGLAGAERTEDLEAIAYDGAKDTLYAFSGSTDGLPTVFRLMRNAFGEFRATSWRPLPSEWPGAAWRKADQKLYVANGATFSTFDYDTGRFGPTFSIPGLAKVTGIAFDAANGDLLAVNQRLYRVAMRTRTIRPSWKALRLKELGIDDSRGVTLVNQQIVISDGSDVATPGDGRSHAIFVLDASATGRARPRPTTATTAPPSVPARQHHDARSSRPSAEHRDHPHDRSRPNRRPPADRHREDDEPTPEPPESGEGHHAPPHDAAPPPNRHGSKPIEDTETQPPPTRRDTGGPTVQRTESDAQPRPEAEQDLGRADHSDR